MATIPGVQRRGLSNRQQPILSMPTDSPLTQQMLETAQDLDQIREVRDRDEIAKAKNKYLMLKTEQDHAYDDDEDFKTIEERYSKNMEEGLALASSGITDPGLRDAFLQEFEVDLAQGKQNIRTKAAAKERDKEVATINEEMEILREQGLKEDADFAFINQAMHERLQAAADRNVISQEESQRISQKFTDDLALGKLKMMPADLRVEALKADWAKNLPSDTRVQLRREAQEELELGTAQSLAMKALDQGLDRMAARKSFEGQKPEIIQRAMQEFNYLKESKRSDEIEVRSEAYTKLWEQMNPAYGKGLPLQHLRTHPGWKPMWETLTKAERDNLYQIEQQKVAGGRQNSDRGVYLKLRALAKNHNRSEKDRSDYIEYFLANSAALNNTDFQAFTDHIYKQDESIMTPYQILDKYTDLIKNQDVKNEIFDRVLRWHKAETERLGTTPPEEEVRKKVSYETTEVVVKGMFNDDVPANLPDDLEELLEIYLLPENADEREGIMESILDPEDRRLFELETFRHGQPNDFNQLTFVLREEGIEWEQLSFEERYAYYRGYVNALKR